MAVGVTGHLVMEGLSKPDDFVASLFFFFLSPRFSLIVLYGLFLYLSSEVTSERKMKFCSRKCRHTRQRLLSFHVKF
jgi:hypothetical protein